MRKREPEFTESSRRIFNRIRSGVNKGKSGRQIQQELRAEGFSRDEGRGFSNASFWRAHRKARAFKGRGSALQHSRLNFVPKKESIPTSPFVGFRNYQYIIEVKGTNIDGEPVTHFITVASNRPISRAAAFKDARASIEADAERYGIDLDEELTFRVMEIMRREESATRTSSLPPRRRPKRSRRGR